jgi:CheY-like chemotaxis protein
MPGSRRVFSGREGESMARVVLVGNDGEVRSAISSMLAEQKIAVIVANDPADAIARMTALDEPPDVVLVDRSLARSREGELIDSIRSRMRLHMVPIVLYTAEGADSPDAPPVESLREAFDAGLLLAIVEAICR